ncbi:MAG: hypothetical protein JWN70_5494 [Planctomycetaceae bacterium]|nr:hypothetical protein [Planctomycetaceae bacterium]
MRYVSNMFSSRWSWGAWMIMVCVLAGCGGGTKPIQSVSGKVTLDGKPVTEGIVNFVSAGGFAASAPIKDGAYSIARSQFGSGIPLGDYKVAVESAPPPDPLAKSSQAASNPVQIPKKYRDPGSSGLTAKVEKASKPFDFALESK